MCIGERGRRTKLEDKRDGEVDKLGAFFSAVTRTAFCRLDSDLEPCALALRRVEDDGVKASLEGGGPELEILEDGDEDSSGVA
jgi:hypothetical protein